jgi:hypothetical protein
MRPKRPHALGAVHLPGARVNGPRLPTEAALLHKHKQGHRRAPRRCGAACRDSPMADDLILDRRSAPEPEAGRSGRMRANQNRFGWPDGGSALPRPAGWTGQRRHRAAVPHLLQAAEEGPRRVADIVNLSSIAGRVASNDFGVYSFTKFGVRGFTESLRQEVTQRHVRVGSSSRVAWRPNWARTTSPRWSPAPATPPSASCGSCPPNSSDRIRCPAKTSASHPTEREGAVSRWTDRRP